MDFDMDNITGNKLHASNEKNRGYGNTMPNSPNQRRPFSTTNRLRKKTSTGRGFTGSKYTGATGHRRMQSALIVGTKINAANCTEADVHGKTSQAVVKQGVEGKFENR